VVSVGLSQSPHAWLTRSTLPSIAEDTILATLRERYLASQPYTAIGSSAVVSLNAHAYIPHNGDSSLQQYVAEYYKLGVNDGTSRDGAEVVREQLGPHVFRLALNAFYNMRRTGQDQIVLFT
jgi:chitin synthase